MKVTGKAVEELNHSHSNVDCPNSKESALSIRNHIHLTTYNLVSAEQRQLPYYINNVNLNCIGFAILFAFNFLSMYGSYGCIIASKYRGLYLVSHMYTLK